MLELLRDIEQETLEESREGREGKMEREDCGIKGGIRKCVGI